MHDQRPRTTHSNCAAASGCIPARAWICLGIILLVQLLAFFPTRLALPYLTAHYVETALDRAIPFVPAWLTVYVLSYVSWLVSGLWILSDEPARSYRVAGAYVVALLLSAAVFLLYPVSLHRPEPTGGDIFSWGMRLLYRLDSPENLCPSLHVLASYFCWRGALGCCHIPAWYKWFNFVFLLLVCLSILFVKQHVIVDIPAAFIVGEVSFQIARTFRLECVPMALAARRRNH